MVGQEHVTDPLSTALDSGRISHAYLFSGPRGCGKTSSARILARSLNCVEGPTSTPCGQCPSCMALGPGGAGNLDVIELDAASHGGVDDTRELRDRAFYAPAESRYRVFIVDEAHMVTTAGFNALLKIVEEPPAHLIFVFATTEPDKVLPTIRSRTHHYPFRLLPPATMRGLLGRICEQEHVPVEEAVYPLVIRAGGGSPRDSLSVLDQLLAGAGPEGVTYSRAVALLGVTDIALIDDAVDALATTDGAALFGTVDRVMEAGHDPRRFAVDLLERLRDLILLRAVPDAADRGLVAAPADQLERMSDQASRIGPASLTRYAELLHAGLGEMRGATAPRLLLEVVCARMLLPAASDAEAATLQRLEQLERQVATGAVSAPAAATDSSERTAPASSPSPASGPPRRRGAEALAAVRESRAAKAAVPDVVDAAAREKPQEEPQHGGSASGAPGRPAQPSDTEPVPSAGPGNRPDETRPDHAAEQYEPTPPETSRSREGSTERADVADGRARTEPVHPDPATHGGGRESRRDAGAFRSASGTSDAGVPMSSERAASAEGGAPGDSPMSPRRSGQGEGSTGSHDPGRPAPGGSGHELGAKGPDQPTDPTQVPYGRADANAASSPSAAGYEGPDNRAPAHGPAARGSASVSRGGTDHAADLSGPAPSPAADPLAEIEAAWGDIKTRVREFSVAVAAMLASGASVVRVEGEVIVFAHQHAALVQRLSNQQSLDAVRSAVGAVLGRDYQVKWVTAAAAGGRQAVGGPGNRGRGGGREAGGRRSGSADGTGGPDAERGKTVDGPIAPPGRGAEPEGYGTRPSGGDGEPAGHGSRGRGRRGSAGAPPRFSRPSQARSGGSGGNGGSVYPDDDIPPPDYPDFPDDPGPADYGYDSGPAAVPPSTPEEEQEMLAESARPVAPGDRRDPDEVALELLASELGAVRLDG